MTIFQFIKMLGGLALFLYGMQVLGDGLKAASSGKLEKLLEKLTSNKLRAALLGTAVTAVIQSSGATVVMVVGLVNSGIMTLNQSVGVTLGANVGTTVTAWLLSMTMISGDNVLVALIKPENFSPLLALIGVAILMMSKKDKTRHVATIMVGFGILMIGMTTMSGAFSALADNPNFTGLMTAFSDNPMLGLMAGLLITVVLQSSSASIGVLQSISMSGTLTFGAMLPALMGANIGSAVTGLLGAIGAKRPAQRAAWLQMIYCLIKAIVFMAAFYILNAFVHFSFMDDITDPVRIAIFHTVFNVVALLVFLPGSDYLVKMVEKIIPVLPAEKEEMRKIPILDEHFLNTPGFALEQARTATNEMAEATQTALFTAMDLIWDYKEEAADKVDRLEKNVDEYEDQLDSYLVKLSRKTMTDKESHELSILLHSINDFERMTDHALNVMQHAQELHNKNLTFSAKACDDMNIYGGAVKEIVSMAVTAFTGNDLNLARQIEPLEIVIDGIDMEEKRRHVRRLRKGKCTVEAGFILQDITTDYERIADHCSNIAVDMLQVNEDGFDTHEYLEREKKADTPEFEAEIRKYEDKYALPKLKKDDDIQTNAVDKYVKSDKTSLSPKQGKLKADKIVKADKASKDKTIKDKKSGKDKADKVDKAKKSSDTAQ